MKSVGRSLSSLIKSGTTASDDIDSQSHSSSRSAVICKNNIRARKQGMDNGPTLFN